MLHGHSQGAEKGKGAEKSHKPCHRSRAEFPEGSPACACRWDHSALSTRLGDCAQGQQEQRALSWQRWGSPGQQVLSAAAKTQTNEYGDPCYSLLSVILSMLITNANLHVQSGRDSALKRGSSKQSQGRVSTILKNRNDSRITTAAVSINICVGVLGVQISAEMVSYSSILQAQHVIAQESVH